MSPHSRKITKLMDEACLEKSNTHESDIKIENVMQKSQPSGKEAIDLEDSFQEVNEIRA